MALDAFTEIWDDRYLQISKSWRAHWENLNTFFGYPPDTRELLRSFPKQWRALLVFPDVSSADILPV